MKLSDVTCRNAKPRDKAYKLFDGGGLYLEIMPTGQRYWRLKYRIHGKEKRLSLGAYPLHSLAEAREQRDKAKKALKINIDPSEEKRRQKHVAALEAAQTFELVAREWHKRNHGQWSKGHADNIIHRLEIDLFPSIGHYAVSKITAPVILSCLQKIEDRGAQEVARRTLSMCGQVCRYAVVTGRAERDVTRDLKGALKRQARSHFAAIDSEEMPNLLKKLKKNEGRLYKQTLQLIHLMMLTFVRTSELIGAQWSEINMDKAEWIIPEERMKMRKPHIVPLSQQALSILKELQETTGHRGYIGYFGLK